jgi:hypothetical protein
MIETGFESRVKVQQVVESQLPEFILDESPKTLDFLKQYYISQEYQGGTIDISENLDQYLKLDNLTPDVIVGFTSLSSNISSSDTVIQVSSTKGFPQTYGLLKIDDEIITYTGITTNTFTGCIRGFSGITSYHSELDQEELIFSSTEQNSHSESSPVQNLSSLFLQEFYKKLKYTLTPGLENINLVSNLNVGNFIKEARTLYQSKGTEESFRILFNILFGETPKIIDLESSLIKPSSAEYVRRKVVVAERITGNPFNLEGQTIFKNTDSNTSASISEVEIISRKGKIYYKLLLFSGYDDVFSPIVGDFNITGNTKNIDYVSVGSSVITVDSTIGFADAGKIYSGNNIITYSDKSINQFFGCSGVTTGISTASNIYSDETYYGYENGDITKKVELRITGVLSNYKELTTKSPIKVGENIKVKHLGEVIENNASNSSYKQIFANSLIYNTSSRYEIKSLDTPTQITLSSKIDKSSLKVGDYIDILGRDTQTILKSNVLVTNIFLNSNQIEIDSAFNGVTGANYDIRRKLKTASSSFVPLEFNTITSDIQNVYNENDEHIYVASNSLPSYNIAKNIFSYNIVGLDGYDDETKSYSIVNFSSQISFQTGNKVYYEPSNSPIVGLEKGTYYIEVLPSGNQIKLYYSTSVIGTSNYLTFGELSNGILPNGTHNFTLDIQKEKVLSPQKILRKFPLKTKNNDKFDITVPGTVGLLKNGVEILNYKSTDKIYYGPLKSVNVLNGGIGYDVINPPVLAISSGNALIQPVVSGSIEKVFVNPQEFDIDVIVSIALTGGNGTGASFEPVIERKRRELEFDARTLENGGGVDTTFETITFLKNHNLIDGQEIIYRPGNNSPLGIGTFGGLNLNAGLSLKNEAIYYSKYINDTTIQLYQSLTDYRSGINTVGFTTIGTNGIHKFATEIKNTLKEIKVISGGTGYTNKKLRVTSSGISTTKNTVTFTNHGFNEGEIVTYSNDGSIVSGLSTTTQYRIIKVDNDTFKLSDVGIAGTIVANYERKKYVSFGSTGNGYHIFSYPEISLNVNYNAVGLGSTQFRGSIVATPIVRGQIVDAYVYNEGVGYGSTILNYHKKPSIEIKTGKNAQFKPIIVGGKIEQVIVQNGGQDYYSTPDIKIVGDGVGAILRPVLVNNKINSIIIINSGYGYTEEKTTIIPSSSGKGVLLDPQVRSLTINNNVFYRDQSTNALVTNEIIKSSYNNLQYTVCGYSTSVIGSQFGEEGNSHSPIIGWAYDGNPIYGSYGYSNPSNINSQIKKLQSGYSLNVNNVVDRPSGFVNGFFVEDYQFTNSGDLDECNGRFCITDEFPEGTYAYFATSEIDDENNDVGVFPYFIGDRYRSEFIDENRYLDQTFDFNNSQLIRNTFPYKVNDRYADNDFIIESNEVINQISVVESVTGDSISDFDIINTGQDYKIGDTLIFDETNTEDSGLSVRVSEISGKQIIDLQTTNISYNDAIFTWNNGEEIKIKINPNHQFTNLDYVNISGFSTSLSDLNGFYQIGVTSYSSTLIQNIPSSTTGIVTDIYTSSIPKDVSIGSSISINGETLKILNIFSNENIIRVVRGLTGVSHTSTSQLNFIPDTFTIGKSINYFDSKINDLVYFNPKYSVGVGTTSGIGIAVTNNIGIQTNNIISVPTQSIYLPNHPFKTNQEVILTAPSTISVANTSESTPFNIPFSGTTQTLYVIRKSIDHIGIVTQIGLTTTTNGLFFISNGSDNSEYSLQSNFSQIKGNIKKINTTISVSTAHNLLANDVISLTVKPNLSVGIGTSTSIKVLRDSSTDYVLINPIGFNSTGINTSTNEITYTNHNLKTGDKVKYSSNLNITGLSTGFYYVYKIDDNKFKLSETEIDVRSIPVTTVSFGSTGGSNQVISLVNPKIDSIRNNNLVFDLTDSSLFGYNFKVFYDQNLENEFVSTGSTNTFLVSGIGTVGLSTNSSLTINYNDDLPSNLYYGLEKIGTVKLPDKEVQNYSQINFIHSNYNGTYKVSGIGTTTFTISHLNELEKNSYTFSECDVLEYKTSSSTALGGIKKVKVISSGNNYKNIPVFINVESNTGSGAYIIPKSNTIGKINEIRILNEGFEYSSDKTLKPKAEISKFITIKNSNIIASVSVVNGGKNYNSPPDLIIVDSETNEKINSGSLIANLNGNSIETVTIDSSPIGLSESIVTIKAINNTNGIKIEQVESSTSGIVTCTLITPLSGFSIEPFNVGDKIFVEGIEKYSSEGSGFNSEDYGYEFFTVSGYQNGGTLNPRKIEFDLQTNPGVAKTLDNLYGTIVNSKNYPLFEIIQDFSQFIVGENLQVSGALGFIDEDLKITESNKNYIKVFGSYNLQSDQIVRGKQSGTVATINEVKESTGEFEIDFSYLNRIGWKNDVGKLNEDTQVIPDNDYYQNLSYSIKSSKEWEDIVSPVNNLLHPSGFKNFADTQILNKATVGVGSTSQLTIFYQITNENRVDTINNFDLVQDYDVFNNTSKFLKFKNKKLSDYLKCKTNRVLEIDDISSEFSSPDEINSFELTFDGTPIFMKTFDPSTINLSTGEFEIENHFFSTGEELIYRANSSSGISSAMGIGSTLNYVGVVTDILPERVFAIKINPSKFKISTRKEYANLGIAVTFTNAGSGDSHEFEMVKKNEKTIITINNIIQEPITYSLISYNIDNGGNISTASTIFGLSGISSIVSGDILKINGEFMKIVNVGLGTTYSGPISFAGTFPLVEVERGFVGTSVTTHSNSGIASVYRGSFNITNSNVYFTDPPKGNIDINNSTFITNVSTAGTIGITTNVITGINTLNISVGELIKPISGLIAPDTVVQSIGIGSIFIVPESLNLVGVNTYTFDFGTFADYNLPEFTSYFSGRVFLRKDYTTNQVYDNISERFTGIGQTYTLTVGGANTVGLGTSGGSGLVFINGVYQTPTTQNNLNNNFSILENTSSGISSIVFSGVTTSGGIFISNSDLNQNELPRGGLIVSLGSTPGLGYAPLVGASVTAFVSGGIITSIGIGTTGNWGSGYRNPVSVGITDSTGNGASITATVGVGGTLSFTVSSGGNGYTNPIITVSSPSYSNLPITGVSRLGIGTTTDCGNGLLISVDVGASSTTGIGSTLFEVTNFKIERSGYQFRKGDVIKPIGLVTAYGLNSPISEFELTILDTYKDSFSAIQFGELDYIDSIKNYQDGNRLRFPLFYNDQLISFEKDASDPDSQLIDFNSLLIIFINGVLQEPGVSYIFDGGTSFSFTQAPNVEDKIDIYFYKGSSEDSEQVNVYESIKPGDDIQIFSSNTKLGFTTTQNFRMVTDILNIDTIETNLYNSQGIDQTNLKPVYWSKQKIDKIINGELVSKSRLQIEPQVYPTAKIIRNINSSDTEIFVDNSSLFAYEGTPTFDGLIISGLADPVSGLVTAIVSSAGTIQSLSINSVGSGYTGSSVTVKISSPPVSIVGFGTTLSVAIGTTAEASISIVNGSLSTVTLSNPGSGYTISNPPQVLIPLPDPVYENITNISGVGGTSGNIVGIATTVGIGTDLALRFTLQKYDGNILNLDDVGLAIGYPIYIFDTSVGNGVTSIYSNNINVVGVGTTFLDNIYYVSGKDSSSGIITCNIHSQSSVVGIATTGNVGKFSWGRLSGFTRSSNPVSIAVSGNIVDSGLTTFPTIQRRKYGLRDTGSISI